MTPNPPLHFVPLGGTGEIGMNLNAYGYGRDWLIVDCGIGFTQDKRERTQVVMADPRGIIGSDKRIVGIIITHVHLDHIGAIDKIWPRMRAPVHLTPFAAAVLRQRLNNTPLEGKVPIVEHPVGDRFQLGPFDIQSVGLTHSTIEATGLILRTPSASVFHTGDYKIDPQPGLGPCSDFKTLAAFGAEGVDVVVGDSTNATRTGRTPSETSVLRHLDARIGSIQGRVVIATFASHIARISGLAKLAHKHGRQPVLLGRSLLKMTDAARLTGWLDDCPAFASVHDAAKLPKDRVMLIGTGTQGEPGSAVHRLAHDNHPILHLDSGDTVIFSSKIIPGNERPIYAVHQALRQRKITVVSEEEDPRVHASGHPYQGDIQALYDALKPKAVLPVHGEARHLSAHAEFARSLGIAHVIEARDGDVVQLGPGTPRVVGAMPIGVLKDASKSR